MHLFIEVLTLVFFLATVAHAGATRGRGGLALFGSLLFLGFVRENFVVLREVLYGFSPLSLMLGKAPLIASIIWGYSIYLAVVWAEEVTGEPLREDRPSGRFLAAAALFMMALACFYEPFLALIRMARWQEGTRMTLGVPWIALVGYPSLTILYLLLRGWAKRPLLFWTGLAILALAHTAGLQALKDLLGW
ncbi:MAG TPA: hypothetical protein VN493_08660 [Thermoanaerobaculia bacterium]|nr:hypothetical protein [Thermoanaerobaculia bacterium]